MPIVTRLGDIIRVHRATLRLYNGTRQFNANVFYNSSWALFSGDSNDNTATTFSGKHYSFEKTEAATLANTRKWASQYFTQYNVVATLISARTARTSEINRTTQSSSTRAASAPGTANATGHAVRIRLLSAP